MKRLSGAAASGLLSSGLLSSGLLSSKPLLCSLLGLSTLRSSLLRPKRAIAKHRVRNVNCKCRTFALFRRIFLWSKAASMKPAHKSHFRERLPRSANDSGDLKEISERDCFKGSFDILTGYLVGTRLEDGSSIRTQNLQFGLSRAQWSNISSGGLIFGYKFGYRVSYQNTGCANTVLFLEVPTS